MSLDVNKSYTVSCDAEGCCNATPASANKLGAIDNALAIQWVMIRDKFYCDECKDKPEYQPKKRGRKPKPKEAPKEATHWDDLKKDDSENSWVPPEA